MREETTHACCCRGITPTFFTAFSEIGLEEIIYPFGSTTWYGTLRLLSITGSFFHFLSLLFIPALNSDIKTGKYLETFLQVCLEFTKPVRGGRKQYSCLAELGPAMIYSWLTGFKSLLLQISNRCSAASKAIAHKLGGLCRNSRTLLGNNKKC